MSDELENELRDLQKFVDSQAIDEGLWFYAQYASESYLQHHLRLLHRRIEEISSKYLE